MAYSEFAEIGGAAPAASVIAPVKDAVLSSLEWSVVAIAERDRLSTLRLPGRIAVAMGRLFGEGHNPRLADPRLEALRRMAVLTWHNGYTVPSGEVKEFLAAGYSPEQYELLVDSIGAARRPRRRR
ncbi:hypothetical protein SAMN05192583_2037 [Sphingomonas gellani]|uniref:Uncharacterized protein n=1 Tax=Sphingomonas gellani TaxID=1166340 RepID=A0A1H8DS95_9SPHN|nr:hypothetical protein [Sphingomonas gellani]SEN10093.1 hypothetical protein SAMN05192583_2037 [Sphingomonas gellani]